MSEQDNGTSAPASAADAPDSVDYKSKYQGLDRAYQKKLTEFNEFKGTAAAWQSELEALKQHTEALTKAKAETDARLAQEAKEKAEALAAAATSDKRLKRQEVLSDFPDLLALEKRGRIPKDIEPEKLPEFLTGLRQDLQEMVQQAAQKQVAGIIPVTSAPSGQDAATISEDTLLTQHQAALDKRNWPEVDRLWAQIVALRSQQK